MTDAMDKALEAVSRVQPDPPNFGIGATVAVYSYNRHVGYGHVIKQPFFSKVFQEWCATIKLFNNDVGLYFCEDLQRVSLKPSQRKIFLRLV